MSIKKMGSFMVSSFIENDHFGKQSEMIPDEELEF